MGHKTSSSFNPHFAEISREDIVMCDRYLVLFEMGECYWFLAM